MSGTAREPRRADRAQQVALFRYQLIGEAAGPALSTRQRGRLVRELASRAHPGPFGDPVAVSRATIDRWIRGWRAGGASAANPPDRQARIQRSIVGRDTRTLCPNGPGCPAAASSRTSRPRWRVVSAGSAASRISW